jgi:CHAT domain-containing protein
VRRFATTRPTGTAVPLALRKAITRLSDLVVTPLGPDIAGKRLAIVADGALEYIPFAMLTTPGTNGVPLVASCELVTLPSASSLAVARTQAAGRERPSRGVAVLADPVFQTDDVRLSGKNAPAATAAKSSPVRGAADLARMIVHDPPDSGTSFNGIRIPRLPYTRAEADSILRTAGGSDNLKAVGFDATKDAVLAGVLKPYRFVHFATHGYVDAARPTLSSVVLSTVGRDGQPRDGFLRSHEIYNLELLADVVVLSACETGLGREVKGEGLVGLTRGFMYAGAPRVVVSLWSVSDRATSALMSDFYREMIQKSQTPAAALRAAQRAMLKDPRWAHPYYWAAFVLEGEWR